MTAIKNGLKTTLRTPLKTVLFSAVLILLAALLTVSLCVYSTVHAYLKDCDEYYHTIAELEYIGSEYPDTTVFDPTVYAAVTEHADEIDALMCSEDVLSFEKQSNAVALIGGLHRWDTNVYDENCAVLRLYKPVYDKQIDAYLALVTESLYSRKDYTDKLILIRTNEPVTEENRLDPNGSCYAVGHFFRGQSANPWFYAQPVSFVMDGETLQLPAAASVDADQTLIDAYTRYAELLRKRNDCCRVQYTASLEDLFPFQQQILSVSNGRMFTAEEYASRAHVCVVSERIAGALEIGVGDPITLNVYTTESDLYDPSRWTQTDDGEYTIVGLYPDTDVYPYRIFLPDADAADGGIGTVTGYRLGQFRIRNEAAPMFLEQAAALGSFGFRVSLYDQGYAAATEPMQQLLFLSVIFLAVCLLLTVAAHALQSHLFITRQSETAQTMHALGSGRAHIIMYFLSAAVLLGAVSAAIGCWIGKLLEGRVLALLQQFAMQFADADLRFSDSRLSLSRTLAFEPSVPLRVYLLSAGLLLFGSVLFTVLFALRSLRSDERKKKKRRREVRVSVYTGRSSNLSGKLKYAMLSMRRGIVRTVAVILLCLIVAVFFGQLTGSLQGYREQLAAYRANATITGFATDAQGQRIDGLLVQSYPVTRLLRTKLVSDYTLADTVAYCRALGVAATPDGEVEDPPTYAIPTSAFAYETLVDDLYHEARWVSTSSVSDSPLFHYAKVKDIQWLDGYSDADFATSGRICALPQHMMEEKGIALGDTVRLMFVISIETSRQEYVDFADVLVVASYVSSSPRPIVFSPISSSPVNFSRNDLDFETYDVLNDQYELYESLGRRTYDSFLFTLKDTDDLDTLRQALDDAGFTYVHSGVRSKPFAIIEDEMYLNTTHSMERQIQYVGVLYNSLYSIAGVIGVVLAWLLTMSRRKEISVMRALGTQPLRILMNFWIEQAVLSFAGIAAGSLITLLIGTTPTPMLWILCGAFWIIWNLATLICLLTGLHKQSYAALTEPD